MYFLKKHKRLLCGFLTIVLLLCLLPASLVSVLSFNLFGEEVHWSDFVGCTASFDSKFPVPVSGHPSTVANPFDVNVQTLASDEIDHDLVVNIVDTYHDDATDALWVRVQPMPGSVLPEKLRQNSWVFYDYTKKSIGAHLDVHTYNKIPLVDNNGDTITEMTIPHDNTETIAAQAVPMSNAIKYQWQICYDREDMLWCNIEGQTSTAIVPTYSMLRNMADSHGCALIRLYAKMDSEYSFSAPVEVTITHPTYLSAEPESVMPPVGLEMAIPAQTGNMKLNAGSREVKPTHSLTIQFVNEDNEKIFEDYTEIWPQGTVITPNDHTRGMYLWMGYDPYHKVDDHMHAIENNVFDFFDAIKEIDSSIPEDATSISLDQDYTFTVVYCAAEVNYFVRFFLQNVYDDNYTLHTSDHPHTGKTGQIASINKEYLANHFPGFVVKSFEDDVRIAADGSTVIDVFLDREYYLANFILDSGGYGTEPVYARYGTTITVPIPTRHGYQFNGWNPMIPYENGSYTTTVLDHQQYIALWSQGPSSFTVVYWKENADPNMKPDATGKLQPVLDENGHPVYGYSYWTHETFSDGVITGQIVNASDYANRVNQISDITDEKYFTFNPARSDVNVLVEGDGTTVVNVYYTRNSYAVYFYTDASECFTDHSVTHTHTASCYQLNCGKNEHSHDDSCLICRIPLHEHTEECCSLPEHLHGVTCCSIPEHVHDESHINCKHVHTAACYTNSTSHINISNNYLQAIKKIGDPVSGRVYEVSSGGWFGTTEYYFYMDGHWYSANASMITGSQIGNTGTYTTSGFMSTTYSAKMYAAKMGTCQHTQHDNECYTCGDVAHTHGNGCNHENCTLKEHIHGYNDCLCSLLVHTHNPGCYSCQTEHHHVSYTEANSCYRLVCDYVHVHSTSNCKNGSQNLTHVIYAKYNSNISSLWPTAATPGFEGMSHFSGTNAAGSVTQSSKVMTMNSEWCMDTPVKMSTNKNNTKYSLEYWFEDPDQDDKTVNSERVLKNGKYYNLSKDYSQTVYYGRNQTTWGYKAITGMKPATNSSNVQVESDKSTFKLFYDLTTDHDVKFINADHEERLLFQNQPYSERINKLTFVDENNQQKSVIDYVPPYPSDHEKNAYEFDGWYTTPECFTGTEVDWDTFTVPAEGDAIVYAKWKLTSHTVNVWLDANMTTRFPTTTGPIEITHGSVTHNPVQPGQTIPSHKYDDTDQYVHGGWFYRDENGVEKAFLFDQLPVVRDLNIYAKWDSLEYETYQVHFVLGQQVGENEFLPIMEGGNYIHVAPSISGTYRVGLSKTIDARSSDSLFPEYQQSINGQFYFPHTNSHTILMSDNPEENVFRFLYVLDDPPGYRVQYLVEGTNTSVLPDKVVLRHENKYSVVTENYKPVYGYRATSFQETKILSVNEEENVITFYYVKDTDSSATYRITYYNTDSNGQNPEEKGELDSYGVIGQPATIYNRNFHGYSLFAYEVWSGNNTKKHEGTITSIDDIPKEHVKLEDTGLDIRLFYKPMTFQYQINHMSHETDQIYAQYTGEAVYGTQFSGAAFDSEVLLNMGIVPEYYECLNDKEGTGISKNISTNPAENVITFYYAEKQATISYQVARGIGGKLTRNSDLVNVRSGPAANALFGSTALPDPGYKFVAWYGLDENGVGYVVTTDPTLTPQPTGMKDGHKFYESVTYFALFEPDVTTLSLTVKGDNEWMEIDPGQTFLINITDTKGTTLTLVLHQDETVVVHNLQADAEYTITMDMDWSWRYERTSYSTSEGVIHMHDSVFKVTVADDNALTFNVVRDRQNYLDGNDWMDTLFQ